MSPAVPLSLRAPASSLVAHPSTPLAAVRQVRVLTRRDPAGVLELVSGMPGRVIEEELAPEVEMPFEAVRLGDLAKPI